MQVLITGFSFPSLFSSGGTPPISATDYLVWGLVAHFCVDFLFQNDWMALNKVSLLHPAAWVHSGLQLAGALLVFPLWAALLLAITHLLIDTRRPLCWWRRIMRQAQGGPIFLPLSIWQDQVAHVVCLAVVALLTAWVQRSNVAHPTTRQSPKLTLHQRSSASECQADRVIA